MQERLLLEGEFCEGDIIRLVVLKCVQKKFWNEKHIWNGW